MSQLVIRNTLLEQLISIATVPVCYENKSFNPDGLDAYLEFSFHPVLSESAGKTKACPALDHIPASRS